MPSIRDNGTYSTRESSPNFGVTLIIEATNDTSDVLQSVGFTGELHFSNGSRETVCSFAEDKISDFSRTRVLSYVDLPPKPAPFSVEPPSNWKADESEQEAVWRPSERIRMYTRRDWCETPVLEDMGTAKIHGRIVVKAYQRFVETVSHDLDESAYDLALVGDSLRVRGKKTSKITLIPLRDSRGEANVAEMFGVDTTPVGAEVLPLRHVRLVRPWRLEADDTIVSAPVEFDINPRALAVQMVKLPSGEFVHASGNVLVYPKDGKVVYQDMARQKLNLLEIAREDVPKAPPEVAFQQDELSGKVSGIVLNHFTDESELAKGQRKLAVTWKLNLKGGEIDGRLRAPFDVAVSELDQATADVEKASQGGDAAEIAKAKAAEARAKAAKSAAETKYKTGLSTERGRIAKLLSCGDVKLATNKGVRGPSNGKAASDACKALISNDDAEATITYTLDRYEMPIALVYSVGKEFKFSSIASDPLLKLDPR